jgi:hypothetical protein
LLLPPGSKQESSSSWTALTDIVLIGLRCEITLFSSKGLVGSKVLIVGQPPRRPFVEEDIDLLTEAPESLFWPSNLQAVIKARVEEEK